MYFRYSRLNYLKIDYSNEWQLSKSSEIELNYIDYTNTKNKNKWYYIIFNTKIDYYKTYYITIPDKIGELDCVLVNENDIDISIGENIPLDVDKSEYKIYEVKFDWKLNIWITEKIEYKLIKGAKKIKNLKIKNKI